MTISATDIKKIQNDIKKIILNKIKLNQLDISGRKDVSELTMSDLDSIFNDLKISFGNDFDWGKYAEAINKEHNNNDVSIFDQLADDSSNGELSLMQLFNAVLSDIDVFDLIDVGVEDENGKVTGKGDGEISAEELQAYFEELAAADDDADSISLSDFANFFAKINEDADEEDKIDFSDTAKKAEEAYNARKKEIEKNDETNDPSGPGSSTPTAPTTGPDSSSDPAADAEQPKDPFPKKVDPATLPTRDKEKYISYSISNLENLVGLDSSKLTGELATGDNPIAGMQNISQEDRTRLQQAATKKETAKADMDKAKAAAEQNKSEGFEYVENFRTATEALTTAQEEVNDSTALVETYTAEQQTLEQTIQGIGESILSLQAQIQPVPDLSEDATEEEKNARLEIINKNKAIENQIKQLEQEKAAAEQQKATIDTNLEQAKATLEQAKATLEQATTDLEAAKTALEEVKDKLTAEETAYLQSIETFNEAGNEYNTVKNEIMQKIQQEVQEQGASVVASRKEEDAKVEVPSLKDDPLALQSAKVLDEIERIRSGELKPENASPEARELYEKYNKLDDKQKAIIKAAYGDEYSFFATMSVLGNQLFSETEKYNDVFFNPQYLTTLYTELEKRGLTPGSSDFQTKVADILKNIDTSKLTTSEMLFQYYTMAGIANGGNLAGTILSSDSAYNGDANSNKLLNLLIMLRNFAWE